MAATTGPTWSNWAGNQRCAPIAVEHPRTEGELADLVKRAAADGRTVKTVGAGHSFTDIACTTGVQVQLGAKVPTPLLGSAIVLPRSESLPGGFDLITAAQQFHHGRRGRAGHRLGR